MTFGDAQKINLLNLACTKLVHSVYFPKVVRPKGFGVETFFQNVFPSQFEIAFAGVQPTSPKLLQNIFGDIAVSWYKNTKKTCLKTADVTCDTALR